MFFFSRESFLFIDHDGDADDGDDDERGNWRRDRHLRSLFGIIFFHEEGMNSFFFLFGMTIGASGFPFWLSFSSSSMLSERTLNIPHLDHDERRRLDIVSECCLAGSTLRTLVASIAICCGS